MQALFVENSTASLREVPRPVPTSAEALIRVSRAGICATDLEIVKGYANFNGILGHEFVGVVEEAPVRSWLGRRVVGSINLGCGQCAVCLGEGPEHCPNRTVLGIQEKDGAFAEYVTLPLANLHTVPECVTDEEAIFTEPLAAALRIPDQLPVSPGAAVAVVGPGRLGLLAGQVLGLTGAVVTMFGRRAASLDLPARMGLKTALLDDWNGEPFDLVVEATGDSNGLEHALCLVRPKGTLVMKSTFAGRANVDLTKLVVDEITVVGSRCGPFAPALRLLERGAIVVAPLVEAEYPLSAAEDALDHAARPGVRKVLLRP